MRLLGGVLVAALACTAAQAADKNGNFQILGAGAVACKKFLDADKQDRVYAETWMAGYITAVNRLTDETWSINGDKSIDDVGDLVVQECNAHVDELFGIAVHNVMEGLYKTRTKLDPAK